MSAISGNHSDQHNNETDNAVIEDHSSGPRTRSSRSGTPRTPNTKINAQAIARILSQRRSPGGSSRPNTPTATFSPTFANGVVTPTDSSNTASSHNGARRVTLHLSRSKYRLMRRVAKICKFHTIEIDEGLEGTEDFNVLWGDTMIPLDRLKQFRPWQHFNHFASMYNITRKHHLSITMGKMQRGLPEHFTFVPRSWSLKTERAIFERHYDSLPVVSDDDKQVFIMKPNAGCQGRGIVLTKDPLREVENPEDFVVQEYVSRPLLIDNRKFDLRVYVLVTSMKYPSIFVFSEGLVRLCAESYEEPNSSNMDNVCKHLTNYAVNKKSTAYQAATQQGDVGSKRNFQWFNKWLDDNITDEMIGNADVGASPAQNPHRGNTAPVNPFNPYAIGGAQPTNTNNKSGTTASAKMWAAIDHIIVKTVLSAQPKVRYAYDTLFPDPKTNDGYTCFEVLGFDILIDHKLQPWLMEVNHTPSFVTATAMDLQVKGALIKEVMSVVQPSTHDRQRFARSTSTSNGRGIATVNGSSAASSSYAADSEASSPAHFTPHPITTTAITDPHYRTLHEQWEDTRIVNFRRVFPVPADHNESEDEINSSRSHSQQPASSARRSASATAAAADSSSERAAASFAALREAKGNSIPTCNLISDINDRIAATITPQCAELRRVVYEEILTFASHAVAAKRDPARLRALAERSHAAGEVAAEEGQWEDVVDSANTVADLNDEEPPAEDNNAEADADAELNDKADETETEKKALSGNGLRQQRK